MNAATTKVFLIFILALAFLLPTIPTYSDSQITLSVKGLACPFCAYGLEKKLREIDGVKGVDVNIKTGIVTLTVEEGKEVSMQQIQTAVKNAGFTPGEVKKVKTPKEQQSPQQKSVTANGKIVFEQEKVVLRTDKGDYLLFEDETGEKPLAVETLKRLKDLAQKGTTVSISGKTHDHAGERPGLKIEKINVVKS